MVRDSTASSSSEDDDGGRAICIWVMGMMIITGAITGGVVSSWPPLDPSKDYTDRTVRESIVSDVQTSYVYLDDQFHSRQIQARRQLPSDSASKAPTGDAISIVPLTHNMELVSYCYTESKQLVRCDLYFNNPDKFEYWKDADQCLAYTIGAPKTTSQDHHCSFYPNDKSSDNKESPCIKSNQTPLNICEQQINWNSTTCFKFNDAPIFSGIYAFATIFT
jgi:hypothetical protein